MAYRIRRWTYDEREGATIEGTPEIFSQNYREGYWYCIEELAFIGCDDELHFYYLVKIAGLGESYRKIGEANSWEEAKTVAIVGIEKEIRHQTRQLRRKRKIRSS